MGATSAPSRGIAAKVRPGMSVTRTRPMRFRSKVDSWFVVVLAAAGLLGVLACIPVLGRGGPVAFLVVAFILFSVLGVPLWLLARTYYEFQAGELIIRSGPFTWRIPLSQVRSVEPTHSPLSSPALSLDRLRIEYGPGSSVMVSPADKEGFLGEINARRSNPSLVQPVT